MSVGLETITDEGYLNNPYRAFRYIDPNDTTQYRLATEKYPHTHTSNAVALNARYFLPWRAVAYSTYRFYTDTWGINAHTARLEIAQPLWKQWVFSLNYRFYKQNAADFYSDLFPSANYQNFMARDKEISAYTGNTVGVAASWEYRIDRFSWLKKGTINLSIDHMMIDYDNFRDLRDASAYAPGQEPLYSLRSNIIQAFFSFWF
jgi:hypothetical protein